MANRRWERALPILAFILLLALVSPMDAAAKSAIAAPEYNVKAAFILLFSRYVTWPEGTFASPEDPIVIAVMGWDPFGRVLDETLRDMAVQGRRLEIRRVADAKEAQGCQVVFIGRSEQLRLHEWLKALGSQSILSVTETVGAIEAGAVVNFLMEGNRLRFEVSLPAAERSALRIASPMLVSAKKVHKDGLAGKQEK